MLENIIKKNEGLIYHVMKRYKVEHIERDDLYQEGSIGMYKAIGKYDSSMNCKFSTYATWYIRAYMTRYLEQNIKKHENIDSLNKAIGEEQSIELQDLIEDDNINIEELIKNKLHNEELQETIQSHCSDLEQKAIHLYYYLELTLNEVMKVLELKNVERVRSIKERALKNIRRSPWGAREFKEIRQKSMTSNSRTTNVEQLVLERENRRVQERLKSFYRKQREKEYKTS